MTTDAFATMRQAEPGTDVDLIEADYLDEQGNLDAACDLRLRHTMRAIVADLANDAPRLEYATILENYGRVDRAKLIRVQCELVKAKRETCCDMNGMTIDSLEPPMKVVPCSWCSWAPLRRRERNLLSTWSKATPGDRYYEWFRDIIDIVDRSRVGLCRGFPSEISLTCREYVGGVCERCEGQSWGTGLQRCFGCNGTGHTPGLAGPIFQASPTIERVRLVDRKPSTWYMPPAGDWYWVRQYGETGHMQGRLPSSLYDLLHDWASKDDEDGIKTYLTELAAVDALELGAAVQYGREQAKELEK